MVTEEDTTVTPSRLLKAFETLFLAASALVNEPASRYCVTLTEPASMLWMIFLSLYLTPSVLSSWGAASWNAKIRRLTAAMVRKICCS